MEIISQVKHWWWECEYFYSYLLSIGDKRVENWALMKSPLTTIILTIIYLAMCYLGPRMMKSREAVNNLRPIIVVYNLVCAGLNLYIGVELFITQRNMTYSWTCEPVDYSWDKNAVRIAGALWWYYASKLFEMFDSLFIILRKRESQLSFLHVYHHATMFALWWIGVKYVAGGSSFLGAMFNCGVHVMMYTYYALAAFGGPMKKYLWWKKYLTLLQMIQFVAALVMGCNAIRIGCDFPMWMQYSLVAYMASFLVLFSDFYYKAYLSHMNNRQQQQQKIDVGNEKKTTTNGLNGHAAGAVNGQAKGSSVNGQSNGKFKAKKR